MSDDRRNSHRIPILSERQQVTLLVGKKELRAQLLDESAGGFAVLAPADVELLADKTVELHTETDQAEARVVYAVAEGDELRLGLSRVETAPVEPRVHWTRFWHYAPRARTTCLSAVLLAVVAAAAAWAIPYYKPDFGLRRSQSSEYTPFGERVMQSRDMDGYDQPERRDVDGASNHTAANDTAAGPSGASGGRRSGAPRPITPLDVQRGSRRDGPTPGPAVTRPPS